MAYAVATSAVARAGAASAACHQILFQLWMANSLLADSLAVASQALLATSLAAGHLSYGRLVVKHTVRMAGVLGVVLMLGLAYGHQALPLLFTQDTAVLALVAAIMPFVVVTQPLNAMAFIWDGVLFGVGGFQYASGAMALCALPAVALMLHGDVLVGWLDRVVGLAGQASAPPELLLVWAGLSLLMALRVLTIYVPYLLHKGPFRQLFKDV